MSFHYRTFLIVWVLYCLSKAKSLNEADSTNGSLDLESSIKQLKRRNTELEMENSNIKKLYTSCSQHVNQFHQKRSSLEKRIADLSKQVEDLRTEKTKLETENGNLVNELKEIKTQLNSLSDQLSTQTIQEIEVDPLLKEGENEHQQFVDAIKSEYNRQKDLKLEVAEEANNGPKDIALFCSSSPQVRISDLDRELVGKNICLQLQLGSPELQTRLLLYCDGNMQFD